jgi:hypothetical protein
VATYRLRVDPKRLITVIATVLTVGATSTLLLEKVRDPGQLLFNERLQVQVERDSKEVERLVHQHVKAALAKVPTTLESAAVEQKVKDLDQRISTVQDQTLGLRQAINPTKPDEVLTIARLTDETKLIKKDLDTFQNTLIAQQKIFQESVLREIGTADRSTNLILIVLVPLVANFLYTVWKDFRVSKEEKKTP